MCVICSVGERNDAEASISTAEVVISVSLGPDPRVVSQPVRLVSTPRNLNAQQLDLFIYKSPKVTYNSFGSPINYSILFLFVCQRPSHLILVRGVASNTLVPHSLSGSAESYLSSSYLSLYVLITPIPGSLLLQLEDLGREAISDSNLSSR